MSDVTLFERKNMRGYSVHFSGPIAPENGYFNFSSMKIGPQTEVILYDRSNDLLHFHNGSTGVVEIVNVYARGNVPENVPISVKAYSIPYDGSAYMKITRTGDVESLTPHSTGPSLLFVILICVVGYMLYVKMFQERLNSFIKRNFSRELNGFD